MTDVSGLWDFSDPKSSERRFREAAATADSSTRPIYETQVARALGLQKRFDEGHQVLDNLADSGEEVAVRTALERGRLFNSAGQLELAIEHFVRAVELAETEAALRLDALHMLAIADTAQAEAWAEQGILEAEGSDDPQVRRWLGPLLNNLGWALFERGELNRALARFEQALDFRIAEGNDQAIQVAKWSVARCLRAQGELQSALSIQMGLDQADFYVQEELAFLHRELSDLAISRARKLVEEGDPRLNGLNSL